MRNFLLGFLLAWAAFFTIGCWGIYDENKSLRTELKKAKEEARSVLGMTKKEHEQLKKVASTLSEAHGRTRIGFN